MALAEQTGRFDYFFFSLSFGKKLHSPSRRARSRTLLSFFLLFSFSLFFSFLFHPPFFFPLPLFVCVCVVWVWAISWSQSFWCCCCCCVCVCVHVDIRPCIYDIRAFDIAGLASGSWCIQWWIYLRNEVKKRKRKKKVFKVPSSSRKVFFFVGICRFRFPKSSSAVWWEKKKKKLGQKRASFPYRPQVFHFHLDKHRFLFCFFLFLKKEKNSGQIAICAFERFISCVCVSVFIIYAYRKESETCWRQIVPRDWNVSAWKYLKKKGNV